MLCQLVEYSLAFVDFLVPESVLFGERKAEAKKPAVVLRRLGRPHDAWVITMSLSVGRVEDHVVGVRNVPDGAEDLHCLQYHLDHVLVPMIRCTSLR